MSIDWSTAPEGATHFRRYSHGMYPWYRISSQGKEYWDGVRWHKSTVLSGADLEARPIAQWTGEGMPPVGTECEYLGAHQYDQWTVVSIFAHWKNQVFVDFGEGWRQERDLSRFRPIRTPEQIAADEKMAAIEQTIKDLKAVNGRGFYSIAEDLYDAGYRKQVMP